MEEVWMRKNCGEEEDSGGAEIGEKIVAGRSSMQVRGRGGGQECLGCPCGRLLCGGCSTTPSLLADKHNVVSADQTGGSCGGGSFCKRGVVYKPKRGSFYCKRVNTLGGSGLREEDCSVTGQTSSLRTSDSGMKNSIWFRCAKKLSLKRKVISSWLCFVRFQQDVWL